MFHSNNDEFEYTPFINSDINDIMNENDGLYSLLDESPELNSEALKEFIEVDTEFKDKGTIYLYSATVYSHKTNESELRALIPTLLFYDSISDTRVFNQDKLKTGAYILFRIGIPVQTILDTISPSGIREINEAYTKDKKYFKGLTDQQIMLKYARSKYLGIRLLKTSHVSDYFIPNIRYTYYKILSDIKELKIEFE